MNLKNKIYQELEQVPKYDRLYFFTWLYKVAWSENSFSIKPHVKSASLSSILSRFLKRLTYDKYDFNHLRLLEVMGRLDYLSAVELDAYLI